MILHLPHASTAIPPDVRAQFILSDDALAAEVLTMTDHFTDELFQYRPHHAALTTAVQSELNERGRCLIVDAHSFPAAPLPYEIDRRPDRPDICFGTDEFHTPPDVVARLVAAAQDLGWSVAVNRPFAGALVPMAYYRQDPKVRSVMIEINRGQYMDEGRGTKSAGFEVTRAKLGTLMKFVEP